MRMDDDSELLTDVDQDPFKVLDDAPDVAYLWYRKNGDCGRVVKGLHHLIVKFIFRYDYDMSTRLRLLFHFTRPWRRKAILAALLVAVVGSVSLVFMSRARVWLIVALILAWGVAI